MKKLLVSLLGLFAFLGVGFSFADFQVCENVTTKETQRIEGVLQILESYAQNHPEETSIIDLIENFMRYLDDDTCWTYEEFESYLIQFIQDFAYLKNYAPETREKLILTPDSEGQKALDILHKEFLSLLTVGTYNIDFTKSVQEISKMKMGWSDGYERDDSQYNSTTTLDLDSDMKYSPDFVKLIADIQVELGYDETYIYDGERDETKIGFGADVSLLKDGNDMYVKLSDLQLNTPEEGYETMIVDGIKKALGDDYLKVNFKEIVADAFDLGSIDATSLSLSQWMQNLYTKSFFGAYKTEDGKTIVQLNDTICSFPLFTLYGSECQEVVEEINWELGDDLVLTRSGMGWRITVDSEYFKNSYLEWDTNKILSIQINPVEDEGYFHYYDGSFEFLADDLQIKGKASLGYTLTLEWKDTYAETKGSFAMTNTNGTLVYAGSLPYAFGQTLLLEGTSQAKNIADFVVTPPTNVLTLDELETKVEALYNDFG